MTWMLVDSSGSMNPDERPIATTLRTQDLRRMPGVNRMVRTAGLEPAHPLGAEDFKSAVQPQFSAVFGVPCIVRVSPADLGQQLRGRGGDYCSIFLLVLD